MEDGFDAQQLSGLIMMCLALAFITMIAWLTINYIFHDNDDAYKVIITSENLAPSCFTTGSLRPHNQDAVFCSLPPEVLQLVFKYLEHDDLVNVALSCKSHFLNVMDFVLDWFGKGIDREYCLYRKSLEFAREYYKAPPFLFFRWFVYNFSHRLDENAIKRLLLKLVYLDRTQAASVLLYPDNDPRFLKNLKKLSLRLFDETEDLYAQIENGEITLDELKRHLLIDGFGPMPLVLNYCRSGDIKLLKLLVDSGCDVDVVYHKFGWPPLLWSVVENQHERAELLCKAGANMNFREDNRAVLEYVKDQAMVDLLCHYGARTDEKANRHLMIRKLRIKTTAQE